MFRLNFFIAALFIASASAFTVAPKSALISRTTALQMSDPTPTSERGVSVDQDGKSNVWAIEPTMQVDSKSSEEKTKGLLVGGGALAAFAVAAGVILTNLPDPSQF